MIVRALVLLPVPVALHLHSLYLRATVSLVVQCTWYDGMLDPSSTACRMVFIFGDFFPGAFSPIDTSWFCVIALKMIVGISTVFAFVYSS